jgi:molybdopterin converting factor small subunit
MDIPEDPRAASPGTDVRIADVPMVTVRYWAAAKQAAGVAEETLAASTLAEALAAATARRPGSQEFEKVLARSSFLVNGRQAGRHGLSAVPLPDGAVVEVLPPFAGG